jgi:RNA polymerase sigma-32 factor
MIAMSSPPEAESEPGRPLAAREVPLAVGEEQYLVYRWRTLGDKSALARLVRAHLGLVTTFAENFRHSGLPIEDLIQQGNLGLMIAVHRFNPRRQTRLASYAIYWIRFSILEHVVRSYGPVRIGTTLRQRKIFFAFDRERREFMNGSEAIDGRNLAMGLGVEQEEIESMILRLAGCDVSLEAPQDRDDRRELRKLLAEQSSPEDAAVRQEEDNLRRRKLFRALKRLSERERAIIKARHMRERPATFVSLGKKFGISRERARQLEECAKAKLRRFCRVPHSAASARKSTTVRI